MKVMDASKEILFFAFILQFCQTSGYKRKKLFSQLLIFEKFFGLKRNRSRVLILNNRFYCVMYSKTRTYFFHETRT